MINKIRNSKVTKITASYLAIMIFLQVTQPLSIYALTEGPSQPEFNSFTPIGTSDMVDLTSGDFNYNIPIMDVGGYPINLAYNSGVTMDQEASWVGLGWNLNVGQINRNVRGLPDDFRGDIVKTENNIRTNVTVGVNPYINVQIIGALDGPGLSLGAGLDVQYNNYNGLNAIPSFGASFKFSDYVSVGMQLSSSVQDGAYVTPSASLSTKSYEAKNNLQYSGTLSANRTYNSRQGLSSMTLSSSVNYKSEKFGMDRTRSVSGSSSYSYLNNTFTPSKRLAMKNNNIRFSFSTGPDVFGVHLEGSTAGYASVQSLVNKYEEHKSYGYEYTDIAKESDLLDFNREKEQSSVSKNTLVLPVTNYTHDQYTIQGQGIGGMFRPHRGQVSQVYDPLVVDHSASNSLGFEIEGGAGFHAGLNFRTTNTTSYTGNWETAVSPFFKEKTVGNSKDYEKVYFKNSGEMKVDEENANLLKTKLGDSQPITLKLDVNMNATNKYQKKVLQGNTSTLNIGTSFNTIKRNNREKRNQVIQKITVREASLHNLSPSIIKYSTYAKAHHTAAYIVTDENSNRHIFGETAYNKEKKEVSFNVGTTTNINYKKGLVRYSSSDNTQNNSKGIDHYFNRETTPAYAHTYLLTSVLSPDYEDLTSNGPTDDDLGAYTKFEYDNKDEYKWRIPYGSRLDSTNVSIASFNEGVKTKKSDQKANYLYGVKENKYLRKIETKTHVAFIDLEERRDGFGVSGENGGGNSATAGKMYRIKTIRLYSKAEAKLANLLDSNPANDNINIKPIKTAHFEYDYSLCPDIENNSGAVQLISGQNTNIGKGKLTLKKVYFTYRGSNMGKFTPYKFNYDGLNPHYNIKAYDIWGNYKPFINDSWNINSTSTTPQEFPYVEQNNIDLDKYAAAWSLTAIDLPSGGKIEMAYEADDYRYVQDQKAMQMFKVDGVAHGNPVNYNQSIKDKLYTDNSEAEYVVVKLTEEFDGQSDEQIIRKYTEGLVGKAIYFNFLLNMVNDEYDYVTGYFVMSSDKDIEIHGDNLFIPMKKINKEGNSGAGANSNPISVAGWFFGRENLNNEINDFEQPADANNVVQIGKTIWKNLGVLAEIFNGPNEMLKGKNCARVFKPDKSWIRLLEPTGSKIGGGVRIKSVILKDQWNKMLGIEDNSSSIDRYAKKYGQEYDYTNNGYSSGVATYEPNVSKENPLINPFYHKAEKLTAQSYQETPFGESFFPSPTVTYSKVTVRNISASDINPSKTGKVVTQNYTSFDFPTRTDYTNLALSSNWDSNERAVVGNMIKSLLGAKINVHSELSMTQGFVIETNDMNGKTKMQEVFDHSNSLISSVEYKYSTKADNPKALENKVTTIDENGKVRNDLEIASQFDVINDMRKSNSQTRSYGMAGNVDLISLGILNFLIGWAKPELSENRQTLKTAVTTKVIHKAGILKEKIAFDLGSIVSTKNHAWDSKTGQVLLTETVNEFDDNYFSLNYPAHWKYPEMGMASENIDLTGKFKQVPLTGTNNEKFFQIEGITPANSQIDKFLKPGDEILVFQPNGVKKLWVYGYNTQKNAVGLMKSNGQKITSLELVPSVFGNLYNLDFRVYRSGLKNMQMANMASITLMKNPIKYTNSINGTISPETIGIIDQETIQYASLSEENPKIINASAIEYSDFWDSQCENGLPQPGQEGVNRYLYNIKGEWRPVRSYAFLTGRINMANANTRKSGYFKNFNPFYKHNGTKWEIDSTGWTYASSVTKYNPFGVEIENKDALKRYSSAQYGYGYKLPVAVASNSKYQEMGFDGFEDYNNSNLMLPGVLKPHFGFIQYLSQNAYVTDKSSHTGKKSLVVMPGSNIKLTRKIKSCQ